MRRTIPLVALASGGTVWMLHLLASYFLVALGCPRRWPALGGMLVAATVVAVAGALVVAAVAWRERRRLRSGEGHETSRLLLGVAALLAALFAIMTVLGGLTMVAQPPCQAAIG